MDFPIHPRKTQGFGRPAQRIGHRRREEDLLDQGRLHARREHFRAMEPRLEAFNAVRRKWDPQGKIRSAQSRPLVGRQAMNVVLFGATRGMGRSLARLLAARGDRLFLLEHVAEELQRSARDLEIRGASGPVQTAACDLLQPETFAAALDRPRRSSGSVQTIVVTAGLFATQEELEQDPRRAAALLTADFTNTVLFCEEARKRLLAQRRGDALRLQFRGRRTGPQTGDPLRRGEGRPVPLPGRARSQVSRPRTEGRVRETRLRQDRDDVGTEAAAVCRASRTTWPGGCLRAIDRGWPEVYVPAAWRWVMLVIRNLPRTVMRRIKF